MRRRRRPRYYSRVEREILKPNHLIHEKSPYLLQHAHNPVDWYPWGEPAFKKAREENKPILLSIGYSTCHWCHVMERESFSNPKIASIMNQYFVCIKVDREERPDVDKIYMTTVQALTGAGGWPLNVFLTPELKPFYGGTYYPPEARWGNPGLPVILEKIHEVWETQRESVIGDSNKLTDSLKAYAAVRGREARLDAQWLDDAYKSLQAGFDPEFGGFSGAPKFPMPVTQNFLLSYYARTGERDALKMAHFTLREMARGGFCDQIGGGFHRYSTDERWRVPHFEKMLYDNAQLAVNFIEAFQASKDPEMERVARETLDYILRDMTGPEGGFYSAEDADSGEDHEHKKEGAFYLWSEAEIKSLLGVDAEILGFHYGVRPEGNTLSDPHGEFGNLNVLFIEHSAAETAAKFGKANADVEKILSASRSKLFEARARRPRPGLDDKILTSWNGLAISAFAKAHQVFEEPKYLAAAQRSARFVKANLFDSKSGRLLHRWRKGDGAIDGLSDDYAFMAQGLIDLYEADFDVDWLDWAIELAETQNRLFLDPDGGYFMTAEKNEGHLISRMMEDSDNVEPSASSVGALNLLRLAQFTDNKDYAAVARKTLERFGGQMRDMPRSMSQMLAALSYAQAQPTQIVVAGRPGDPAVREMLKRVHSRLLPAKILIVVEEGRSKERLAQRLPFIRDLRAEGGKPTAYVCVDQACRLPASSPSELDSELSRGGGSS